MACFCPLALSAAPLAGAMVRDPEAVFRYVCNRCLPMGVWTVLLGACIRHRWCLDLTGKHVRTTLAGRRGVTNPAAAVRQISTRKPVRSAALQTPARGFPQAATWTT